MAKRIIKARLYNVEETALLIGVHVRTVRNYRKDGYLKGKKERFRGRQRKWMFKGEDIKRFMDEYT